METSWKKREVETETKSLNICVQRQMFCILNKHGCVKVKYSGQNTYPRFLINKNPTANSQWRFLSFSYSKCSKTFYLMKSTASKCWKENKRVRTVQVHASGYVVFALSVVLYNMFCILNFLGFNSWCSLSLTVSGRMGSLCRCEALAVLSVFDI